MPTDSGEEPFFEVPVVEVLKDSTGKKRISVTVVHTPQVQRWGLERYFASDLKWRMFRGNVSQDNVVQAMSSEAESDADDEVKLPNEMQFEHRVNRRSRGAVQHDYHTWSRHSEDFSAGHYTLAIACYKRWQSKVEDVPFAVVVRVEDTGRMAKIYTETVRVLSEIEVEARGRT